MTDRKLLELAAKAYGLDVGTGQNGCWFYSKVGQSGEAIYRVYNDSIEFWNPLEDDGDAFRLAVKLDIVPRVINGVAFAWKDGVCDNMEQICGNLYAATRRAITRAAADIGKGVS